MSEGRGGDRLDRMGLVAVDGETGRVMSAGKLQLANKLWEAKETKPFWDVVEEVVKAWQKAEPTKWHAYIVHLRDVKQAQKKTWVGTREFRGVSKDRQHDAYLSLVVDFPAWIMLALRKLYGQDLQFDKDFFAKFARKFPIFAIREKL